MDDFGLHLAALVISMINDNDKKTQAPTFALVRVCYLLVLLFLYLILLTALMAVFLYSVPKSSLSVTADEILEAIITQV